MYHVNEILTQQKFSIPSIFSGSKPNSKTNPGSSSISSSSSPCEDAFSSPDAYRESNLKYIINGTVINQFLLPVIDDS